MEKNIAIKVTHVTKRFKLYYDKAHTLKEKLLFFSKKNNIDSFYSDSFKSDFPMLEYAKNAYLVKKDIIKKIDPKTYK